MCPWILSTFFFHSQCLSFFSLHFPFANHQNVTNSTKIQIIVFSSKFLYQFLFSLNIVNLLFLIFSLNFHFVTRPYINTSNFQFSSFYYFLNIVNLLFFFHCVINGRLLANHRQSGVVSLDQLLKIAPHPGHACLQAQITLIVICPLFPVPVRLDSGWQKGK